MTEAEKRELLAFMLGIFVGIVITATMLLYLVS